VPSTWKTPARPIVLVAVPAAAAGIVDWQTGATWIADMDLDRRAVLYQTLAGTSGALLGLGLATFTILFAVPSASRLGALLAHAGRALRWYISTVLTSLATVSLAFAALIVLHDGDGRAAQHVAVGLFAALAVSMALLVWISHQMLRALSADASRQRQAERGDQDDWTMPDINPDDYRTAPDRPLRADTRESVTPHA
jgi:hypothetical protein